MPRTRLALLAIAVATAGCLGVAAPTADVSTPAIDNCPLGQPPETPQDRSVTSVPDAPPGLTADGVTDPRRLAVAHFEALDGQSFTAHTAFEVDAENATRSSSRCALADAGSGRFYVVSNSSEPSRTGRTGTTGYSDGETTVLRTHFENGTTDAVRQPAWDAPVAPSALVDRTSVYRTFSATNTTLAGVSEVGGRTFYHLERAGTDSEDGDPSRIVRLRAVVDDHGVVRRLTVSRRVELRDGVRTVSRTTRFGAVGATTVPRPDWFAANATTTDA